MKQAMSAFDLRAIAHEMQAHLGAWVKKSYMPHYEQVVLRFNPKDADAFDLVIVRGRRISTSTRDRPMPMSPPPFAMLLRKQLGNARLIAVEQLAFDRLLRMTFTTKGGDRHLIIECFGDGNVILLDENDTIIQPLTHATYRDRTLKRGEAYLPPPPALDPDALTGTGLQPFFQRRSATSPRRWADRSTSADVWPTRCAMLPASTPTWQRTKRTLLRFMRPCAGCWTRWNKDGRGTLCSRRTHRTFPATEASMRS